MGSIYRRNILKPIPAGAELVTKRGKRFARWTDRRGKTRTAEIRTTRNGDGRIVTRSKYLAKYRDGEGIVREVATGCADETAARSVLADLERRAELVKSKVMTAAEDCIADHADLGLADHIAAFIDHLNAKGVTTAHRKTAESRLTRLRDECGWARLGDMQRASLESWLAARSDADMSARTRNGYRDSAVGFARWLLAERRVLLNPFDGISKLNESADRRRQRRALTEAELRRLIHVARTRPLAELGRKPTQSDADPNTPKRANWTLAELTYQTIDDAATEARRRLADKPERIAQLEATGIERALIYKSLSLTGLRRGELASISVGQVHLEATMPHIELHAADEKARRGAEIPLQRDLAADLRENGSARN